MPKCCAKTRRDPAWVRDSIVPGGLRSILGQDDNAPDGRSLVFTTQGGAIGAVSLDPAILTADSMHCPGSEKDITEVSGTSSPGSTPGRGTTEKLSEILRYSF
jgi:hypothetical protein